MRLLHTDPVVYLILVLLLGLSMSVGFVTQQRTLMPVLGALILWPFLVWSLRHARIDVALRLVVFWAVVVFGISVVAGLALGSAAQAAAPGSVEFNASQLRWITGIDSAREPASVWLPGFARRSGLLLAGGALTAGLVPLAAAARYLTILGLWAANLLGRAGPLAAAASIAPWFWAEAIGQVLLVIVLAEPLITGDVSGLLTSGRRRYLLGGLVAFILAVLFHLFLPDLIASPLRALTVR